MEGLQMIQIDSIISCTSDSNYTNFHLKNKQKITASRTLKETEELLEGRSFVRVHNSYLVNLNEIQKYVKGEGGYLVMTDGTILMCPAPAKRCCSKSCNQTDFKEFLFSFKSSGYTAVMHCAHSG